ncbi:MAG: DUF2235 domain-containing protein [Nitrospira sp.]|nr:DUF2235 domain-containing protein [Nitrospira sp.]
MEGNKQPTRRLVMCFDGTWNSVESRTNVSRLYETILDQAPDKGNQLKFYDEGVGRAAEATTPWTRLKDGLQGGIFGDGILRNVLQAYCWLIEHYKHASEGSLSDLYIFGFSRGAFTARLFAGLLGASGILKREEVAKCGNVVWDNKLVQAAWKRYKPGRSAWRATAQLTRDEHKDWEKVAHPALVKFLGVWDTVGRYGIPTLSWGSGFFKPIRFNDCSLGRHVLHARHAMAIDEHRADFNVRLWDGVNSTWSSDHIKELPETTIRQQWFAGAHAQVGGGYENDQLCHYPLQWMADQASAVGLGLMYVGPTDKPMFRLAPLVRDHLVPIIDSHSEFAFGLYRWISDPLIRQIRIGTVAGDGFAMEIGIDDSVFRKVLGDSAYRPVNLYHQGRLDLHAISDRS